VLSATLSKDQWAFSNGQQAVPVRCAPKQFCQVAGGGRLYACSS
jgi:hypothetical protein